MRGLRLGFALLAVLLSLSVSEALSIPSGGDIFTNTNLLGIQGNTLSSILLAVLVTVVVYLGIQRTATLSGGAAPIAIVLGIMSALFFYANPGIVSILFVTVILGPLFAAAILLVALPSRNGSRLGKALAGLAILVVFYLVVENNSGFNSYISNLFHVNNFADILSVLIVPILGFLVIYIIYRMAKGGGILRKLVAAILVLIVITYFFLPQLFVFLASPIILIPLGVLILVSLLASYGLYRHQRSVFEAPMRNQQWDLQHGRGAPPLPPGAPPQPSSGQPPSAPAAPSHVPTPPPPQKKIPPKFKPIPKAPRGFLSKRPPLPKP